MKPPSKVVVGATRFAIELTADLEGYGDTTIAKSRIRVQKGMDVHAERDTVMHEVLHALLENVGLAYEMREDDYEEKVVRRLAPALLDLLRRNPRLVQYLTSPA